MKIIDKLSITRNTTGHFKILRDGWEVYLRNGLYHRIGGPALIFNENNYEYFWCGHRHNSRGPAIISESRPDEWYLFGCEYEFNRSKKSFTFENKRYKF